jgi:eukaryotic-like serine/threonine-protein kinase
MDAAREDRLEELFEAALAVAPTQRAAFLDQVCAGDTELRDRLAEHLTHAARAYEFVDRVARPAIARCAEDLLGGPPSAAEDSRGPRVGEDIAHFRVLERLGGGGMGVVYKAIDVRLGTTVALKFLPAHSDNEAKGRFIQEAKAASALDHPNICTIHEIGETETGELFIAMAYYEGPSLKQKIGSGPLPVREALAHVADVAEGLRRAHEARIVHRDIKPANVMLGEHGQVKIVDFGLAKMSGADLTREPRAMGTIAYMSPEQTFGAGVDRRTDIWSLGVLFYEMLTGHRPFRGDSPWRLIYAIRYSEPIPVRELRSEVPAVIASVVNRCLEKDPANRYQTVSELLDAVRVVERVASSSSGEPRFQALLRKFGLRD